MECVALALLALLMLRVECCVDLANFSRNGIQMNTYHALLRTNLPRIPTASNTQNCSRNSCYITDASERSGDRTNDATVLRATMLVKKRCKDTLFANSVTTRLSKITDSDCDHSILSRTIRCTKTSILLSGGFYLWTTDQNKPLP